MPENDWSKQERLNQGKRERKNLPESFVEEKVLVSTKSQTRHPLHEGP